MIQRSSLASQPEQGLFVALVINISISSKIINHYGAQRTQRNNSPHLNLWLAANKEKHSKQSHSNTSAQVLLC